MKTVHQASSHLCSQRTLGKWGRRPLYNHIDYQFCMVLLGRVPQCKLQLASIGCRPNKDSKILCSNTLQLGNERSDSPCTSHRRYTVRRRCTSSRCQADWMHKEVGRILQDTPHSRCIGCCECIATSSSRKLLRHRSVKPHNRSQLHSVVVGQEALLET